MQKGYPVAVYADMEGDGLVVANAKAAVARLAFHRPLGEWTFRKRAERLLLRLTRRGAWTYCGLVLVVFCLLQFEADRWWFATVLMLAPTWPGLLPLAVLGPLALLLRARLLVPLIASGLIYLFGILGFCVPWPWDLPSLDISDGVTVLTCNVDGGGVDEESLNELLAAEKVQVVAVQDSGRVPESVFPEDWEVVRRGGLTLASRFPLTNVRTWQRDALPEMRQRVVALYALVARPDHPIGVCTVRLSSPRGDAGKQLTGEPPSGESWPDRLQRLNFWRDRESRELSQWIGELPRVNVIAGDFGMTVQSRLYRRWWAGYDNAFSQLGMGLGWTRCEQLGKFPWGARTDHALIAGRWSTFSCRVAKPIGPGHRPLVVQVSAEP